MDYSNLFGLTTSKISDFRSQNYYQLKKQCLEKRMLFCDPYFPANACSIVKKTSEFLNFMDVKWLRPKEICQHPYLFVEGVSCRDVRQGDLGNCWFAAACSCITLNKYSWMKIVADYKEQEWDLKHPEKYLGIFRFRFCKFGEWTEVVIDDRLPTLDGRLLFCHSDLRNEFWSALLEKAYAKLKGSYAALDGGELTESLMDFTGGVVEPIKLSDISETEATELFQEILIDDGHGSLMCTSIPADSPEQMEFQLENGLIIGHAYSITAVRVFTIKTTFYRSKAETIRLLRLCNPWGSAEWNGPYSQASKEYKSLNNNRNSLNCLSFSNRGEFWMTYEDFLDNFRSLFICRFLKNSIISITKKWYENSLDGSWKPENSGGCLNFKQTFLMNPQYLIFNKSFNLIDIQILLIQKMERKFDAESSSGLNHIGFSVVQIETNRTFKIRNLEHATILKNSNFRNSRSIYLRLSIKRGYYAIIPSTFKPGVLGDYVLKVYSDQPCVVQELFNIKKKPDLFKPSQSIITRITIRKALGLPRINASLFGANPYCCIECGQVRLFTSVAHETLNPQWTESFILYRNENGKTPIRITMMSKNEVVDDFIGYVNILHESEDVLGDNVVQEMLLYGPSDLALKSTLFISLQNYSSKAFAYL